jgi:hypothetical protein
MSKFDRKRRNHMLRKSLVICAAATLPALFTAAASAATLAYEGFDYTAGTLLQGQTGGTGWTAGWTGADNAGTTAISPNFTYTGLTTTGLRGQVQNDGLTRQLSTGTLGAPGTTVWFSFMGTLNSWLGNPNMQIGLAFTNVGTQVMSLGQGNGGGNVAHSENNSWVLATALSNTTDQTILADAKVGGGNGGTSLDQFFVGKIDFGVSGSTVDIWVNPTLGGAAPTGGTHITDSTFHAFTFDGILLNDSQGDGKPLFDEIRIGTDFASVQSNVGGTAVPEPASLSLLGLAGLAMARRRR